ncbi:hypothetical protein FQN60_013463 [Etheostoma spectabile]|uniref:Uncharacterized protein n=1 Tax=Etheostoma spectabile TaxID=54343 RepID=A0A5J5CHM8_9PERO|nr:hypothetical protein FQN60_013463 [Etheostoma spectabile]
MLYKEVEWRWASTRGTARGRCCSAPNIKVMLHPNHASSASTVAHPREDLVTTQWWLVVRDRPGVRSWTTGNTG